MVVNKAAAERTLAEHRITSIRARRLRDRFPRRVGRNAKGGHAGRGAAFQARIITTDQGVTGWGMAHGSRPEIRRFIGKRVGDLFDMDRGVADEAFQLQIPLYDLVGRILRVPVYELLGSAGPMAVPIYSGAIYFDDLDPPSRPRGVAEVVASCQQDYDAGYRAFKLKIGRGFRWMDREAGIRRDIEVTRAVRERFGACRILVDANDGYTCADFIRYLNGVADCDLYWIEEPFRESRRDLLKLKREMERIGCRALIADGEARTGAARAPWKYGGYTRQHVNRLLALAGEELVDVVLLDLGIVGFTRWCRVMPELIEAGVRTSPHTWCWTPRPYYAAHLAAGMGNVVMVEGIPGGARGVDYSAYKFRNGELVMPRAPGFGLSLRT